MADSSRDGCDPYDLSSDFDFEHYYGEDYAGPESTPDAEPRAHNGFESLGEPSQPPIRTGNEASKTSDLVPTAIVPFNNNWLDNSYDVNIGTSSRDPMQILDAGVDSHYGVASTNPSYFGFTDLWNNANGGSSHVGVLDESGKADAELLHFDCEHLLDSAPVPLSNSGLQRPVPALVPDQTTMPPSLADSQHRQDLDPIQPISTLSSVQHDQPVQNSDINMITRKRPSSPQLIEAQRLYGCQQLFSKRTGIPETSLGLICFNSEPAPKRSRTISQKENKKAVEREGGSCLLCFIDKKKCSGQRPCDHCRTYWHKRVHDSTSFMWTCTVQTKLTDLNIFKYPLGISESAIYNTFDLQFGGIYGFLKKFVDLFNLMLNLEPLGPNVLLNIAEHWEENGFDFHAYTHGLIRWKRPLVYLVPQLQHDPAYFERLYRYLWSYVFNYCDQAHRSPHKDRAVMVVVLVFHGIKRLRETEVLDPAVTDHLQLALQDRLKIFCSRVFGFDASKRIMCDEKKMLAAMVDSVPELSSCLPPRYRHCSESFDIPAMQHIVAYHSSETRLDLPSCLLRRFDSCEYCYDDTKTDSCCCGWAFDSTPPGIFSLFGHSASSFAHYVHFRPRETILGKGKVILDPCQAMNAVFGGPRIDNSSLRKRMMVFRGIMTFLLRRSFHMMDFLHKELNIDLTRKIPEDRLDRLANNYRQRIFAHILRSAVTTYHDFRNSKTEGGTDAEDIINLPVRFSVWMQEKDNSSEIDDFDGALIDIHVEIEIHVENFEAERSALDDVEVSSD